MITAIPALLILATVEGQGANSQTIEAEVFEPPQAADRRAPDGSAATCLPFSVNVPARLLDDRGTIALWVRPEEELRGERAKLSLIDGEALQTFLDPRGSEVWVLLHSGPAMTHRKQGVKADFYWFGAALTHLKAGRWYHFAWTWDAGDSARNGFFLNGVRQGNAEKYAFDGQLKAAGRDVETQIGAQGLAVSALSVYSQPLEEAQLEAITGAAGVEPYTDEGLRFSGQRFAPSDVDWAHPVYETSFDDPSTLADWKLEGGRRMSVADGSLVLESDHGSARNHLVCWLEKEIPADFLCEFSVRPEDRHQGLNIVFFNARGIEGQSIFDPSLGARDGTFRQYTSGDINCYHASYWAAGRGTTNCRKNKGFHLVAVGRDLVEPGPPGAFQTVRLYKRGGKIRLMVDDVVAVVYDDDGRTCGPAHTHAGWIGLRQMGHTQRCEYGHFRVYSLKP